MYNFAIEINQNYAETYYNKGKRFRFIFSGIALTNLR